MRMCVLVRRFPVRAPPRVTDAGGSVEVGFVSHCPHQFRQFTFAFADPNVGVADRQSGRVVPTVLQLFQPAQECRDEGIAPVRTSDDATHYWFSPLGMCEHPVVPAPSRLLSFPRFPTKTRVALRTPKSVPNNDTDTVLTHLLCWCPYLLFRLLWASNPDFLLSIPKETPPYRRVTGRVTKQCDMEAVERTSTRGTVSNRSNQR